MAIRLVAGSLLFLAFPVLAQEGQKQDPDKPKPSAEQQARELAAEKERLQREIQYAKERVSNSKTLLREKLAGGKQSFRSIDAGTTAPPVVQTPAAPQRLTATVATGDMLGDFPGDTIALVNRQAIRQAALDQMTMFLRSGPAGATEQQNTERAMYELLRVAAVASAFEENVAAERAATAAAALADGKPVADLVKEYGTCQGAGPDGKVEVMRNSIFGPMVEMMAFGTKAGAITSPFRTANGIMVFRCEKLEKGASPELDKVVGHAIEVPYTTEAAQLQKANLAINMGQVQIVVKDEKTLSLLPPMFRPALQSDVPPVDMAQPSAAQDQKQIESALAELGELIQKLSASNEPGAKDQVKALEMQAAELKNRLQALQPAPAAQAAPADVQRMMQELQAQMAKLGTATDDASKAQLKQLQERYAALKAQLRGGAQAPTQPDVKAVPEPKK